MDFSAFCRLTLSAFAPIEKEFFISSFAEKNRICFHADSFDVEVYLENNFEVNLNFSFYEKGKCAVIPLKNIMVYLGRDSKEIEKITGNQFSSEQAFLAWISEVAKLCEPVLERISYDKNLLSTCYRWQNDALATSRHLTEIHSIKRNLNDLWKSKDYAAYLSYFVEHSQALASRSDSDIFIKRAEYIRQHTEDI